MTDKEQIQREHERFWARRSEYQFRMILILLICFAISVLAVIAMAVVLKYSIEIKKIDQASFSKIEAFEGPTHRSQSETQHPQWSPERTARYIDDYVDIQAHADNGKHEQATISRSKFLDFLNGLEISGTLSKEAVGAVRQLRQKLIDATVDVSVDTIKKLTSKLFSSNDKQDTVPVTGAMLNSLAVNVSCAAQPSSITKTAAPSAKPATKMMCPVPMVPFGQKKD